MTPSQNNLFDILQFYSLVGNINFEKGQSQNMLSEYICDGCEEQTAILFCDSCNAFYCPGCDNVAHSVKNTKEHARVSAEGSTKIRYCSSHNGRRLELFCKDCSAMICLLCREYGPHKGHGVDLAENTASALRSALHSQVNSLNEIANGAISTLSEVEKTIGDLGNGTSGQIAKAKSEVSSYFDQLLLALNNRRAELISDVQHTLKQKQTMLFNQGKELDQYIANCREKVDAATAVVQMDDFSVCDAFSDTSADLDSLKGNSLVFGPSANSEIPTAFDETLPAIIRTHGIVGGPLRVRFSFAESGICKVEWDEPSVSDQRSWVSYNVKARLLSVPPNLTLGDMSRWASVAGCLETDLTVTSKIECVTEVTAYPGCTLEFLVQAVDSSGKFTAWSCSPQKLRVPVQFRCQSFEMGRRPFGSNGLFYFLGTKGGQSAYVNPHISKEVIVTWSSIGGGSVDHFVDNDPGTDYCYTEDEGHSWMAVDIGASRLFRPTSYCLRHDMQGPRGILRNWLLQARVRDDEAWSTISVHQNDYSLAALPGSVAGFSLTNVSEGFRYFRILQNGRNSSEKHRLLCAGFELYGTLY